MDSSESMASSSSTWSVLYTALEIVKRASQHNQVDEFTHQQALVQRILATASSCASITSCLAGMYMFLAIDPRRLIFRHQLIFFLLFFDLLKAIILLLYPTRVLTHSTSYYNERFCQVVGFFTATAVEGADLAILAFAIHTYLLIFRPQLNTKVKSSTRVEGGLYRYRNYVYALSFFIPIILASLGFIHVGYTSLVCWCYLPERPVWYRLVLSWVPRWCIIVIIFTIYALIYFHVIKEFKTLGGVFTTFHKNPQQALYPKNSHNEKPSLYSAFKYFLDRITPKWIIPDQEELKAISATQTRNHQNSTGTTGTSKTVVPNQGGQTKDEDPEEEEDSDLSSTPVHVDTENIIYDAEFHAANLEKFRKRQKIIEKQMKSIFIYPFAYCFVWLFPFMLYITQINYEEKHGPVYWLNCMGAFMQPLNGFVDTLVFFHREQPWKYTIMRNFEKDHMTKMDNLIFKSGPPGSATHGSVGHREHDSESIATSARLTKNSLSASTGLIDIKEYPEWRQWLSWARLPFFILPTDKSASQFQTKYISEKLSTANELSLSQRGALNMASRGHTDGAGTGNPNNSFNMAGHDFSDILSGDLAESNFRSNLENFSLNFNGKSAKDTHLNVKRSSIAGSSSRKNSIISSTRSTRSRQISTVDGGDPVLVEGRKTSYPNAYTGPIELKPLSRRANSGSNLASGPKKSLVSRNSFSGVDSNDMDFLEFLRNGP